MSWGGNLTRTFLTAYEGLKWINVCNMNLSSEKGDQSWK